MFQCLGFGFWWILPVAMIVMIVFCFLMMRKAHWTGCCGRSWRGTHDAGMQDEYRNGSKERERPQGGMR